MRPVWFESLWIHDFDSDVNGANCRKEVHNLKWRISLSDPCYHAIHINQIIIDTPSSIAHDFEDERPRYHVIDHVFLARDLAGGIRI